MKIFIVGCYGRGLWLAQQMAKKNLPTSYFDITDQMGHWSPDDWEGPFGFFRHEAATEEMVTSWTASEPPVEVPYGCGVLFNDLPFNPNSQLSNHLLSEFKGREKYLQFMGSSLASTEIVENSMAPEKIVSRFQWGAPFSYRRRTRLGLQRSLEQLAETGVQVFNRAQIKDVSLESGARLGSLEVALDRNDVVKFSPDDQVVWCLSAQESQFIMPEGYKKIFRLPLVEPLWFWARFRLRVEFQSDWTTWLPPFLILTDDVDAQWVRENLCILRQASSADQWDCWLRLPVAQRFNSQYLKEQSARLEERLKERFPHMKIQVIEWPQESRYTWQEVGPPTHPVWEKTPEQSLKSLGNVHTLGIESAGSHDFEAKALHENQVTTEIFKRFDLYLEKLKKEKKI